LTPAAEDTVRGVTEAQVQDAYRRLAQGHVLGKIVLLP
jgi:hypothetical protein